jgi:hypothetical protein
MHRRRFIGSAAAASAAAADAGTIRMLERGVA